MPDSAIELDGYTFFRNDCLTLTNGGGVAAYIPSQLKSTRCLDIESTCKDTEVMRLELRFRSKRLLLGIVYRPPDDSDFFTHFETAPEMATAESSKSLMVIGDFNCHLS